MQEDDKLLIPDEKNKLKTSLGGINEELDNLFLSNVESEENQEMANMREKEFEELLDL